MNANQQTFLQEYLRTGDKLKAYQTAYPKAKESSLKNAANRLLANNPEIAAAVAGKRAELYEEAVTEAKEQIKADIVTELEAKQILSQTIRGKRVAEKVWHTRHGFQTHDITPTHTQMLGAIRQLAMMEGWHQKGRAGGEKKEKKPEEPVSFKIYMNKLPWEEYNRVTRNTLEAYYDPDGPTMRCQPDNNHTAHQFLPMQKKREERRDEERAARMTPQLKLEEEQALREFESRAADEAGYRHHTKIIDDLVSEYSKAPDPAKLETLTAIQKMCGLRFLHHRHRYEAERTAGWQFHPLNHALIKPVNDQSCHSLQGCHSERSEESARPMQSAQSTDSTLIRQQTTTKNTCHSERSEESAGPTHPVRPEQQPDPPTPLQLLQQGYQPLNELLQDEYDYYLKNQGSTTWQQLNGLRKFAQHRNASHETRKQIETETGWLYHPTNPNYAKRHPNKPLVRTRFPGPPRYG